MQNINKKCESGGDWGGVDDFLKRSAAFLNITCDSHQTAVMLVLVPRTFSRIVDKKTGLCSSIPLWLLAPCFSSWVTTMEDKNPWNGSEKPSLHILNLSNIQMLHNMPFSNHLDTATYPPLPLQTMLG